MKEKNYLEDYELGEVLITPGRTITEADIVNFAGLTGDWNPLHTDVTYAETTVFGERIAHGFLTLVVGSALIFRLGPFAFLPRSFIAFYGMDGVRFPAPVRIGDTIRLECEITDVAFKNKKMGVMTARGAIKNQKDEVCCAYTVRLACGRRPA